MSATEPPTDILIVGAGPAGLAAGIVAGRQGVSTTLFENEQIGGELPNRNTIENIPGHLNVSGTALRATLVEQLDQYEVSITRTAVTDIDPRQPIQVETAGSTYWGRAVILATGGRPTRLDVPGESRYTGRGVFYCATCDGPLYANGVVAVVGSSDWALDAALFLTKHTARVILIEKESRLTGRGSLVDRVVNHDSIAIRRETAVKRVLGDEVVTGLELADGESETPYKVAVDGLYVQQGRTPRTEFVPDDLITTNDGAICVDRRLETDVRGLFAAGDVRDGSPHTVASAIGDGTTAARSAIQTIETQPTESD